MCNEKCKRPALALNRKLDSGNFSYISPQGQEFCRRPSSLVQVWGCRVGSNLKIANFCSGSPAVSEDYLDRFITQGSESLGTALKLLDYEEFLTAAANLAKISKMLDKHLPHGNYWVLKNGSRVIVSSQDGSSQPQVYTAAVILKM